MNIEHEPRSWRGAGWLAALALTACGGEVSSPPATSVGAEPLIGGIPTYARPEIGLLNACTATLVDSLYVVTAARCFDYATGPVNDAFRIWDTSGALVDVIPVDYAYSLSSQMGDYDVAFARLTRPAPSWITPGLVVGTPPPQGATVTVFGGGCVQRPGGASGWKQYITYSMGDTNWICHEDIGGPRVLGPLYGPTMVWGVNSGYAPSAGVDYVGQLAAASAPEALQALLTFGQPIVSFSTPQYIPIWAQEAGVTTMAGDFDGDGLGDLAFTGGRNWGSINVGFGDGAGGFAVSMFNNLFFPTLAQYVRWRVAGDFDGDGASDIALVGAAGWTSIPVAFSNRDGTFRVTNLGTPSFSDWAADPDVELVVGDFDGDGADDIALAGGAGWNTIPVAFSNRDGTFRVTTFAESSFSALAENPQARLHAGDFDGDGDDDLALSNVNGWTSIPVASSNRDGTFGFTNNPAGMFPVWTNGTDMTVVAGDFDADGRDDLAGMGPPGWRTITLAISKGAGNFHTMNLPMPNDWTHWATEARHILAVRLDADARDDFVLAGGNNWGSVQTALLR